MQPECPWDEAIPVHDTEPCEPPSHVTLPAIPPPPRMPDDLDDPWL